MRNLVEQYPHCLYWVEILQNNNYWKDIRFKKLNVGYPKFVMYPALFDEVNLEDFLKLENNRIPFFIGSQFGINPRLETVYSVDDENVLIAILCKSLLSSTVAGLKIYSLKRNHELKEIIYFKNNK